MYVLYSHRDRLMIRLIRFVNFIDHAKLVFNDKSKKNMLCFKLIINGLIDLPKFVLLSIYVSGGPNYTLNWCMLTLELHNSR